MLQIQPFNVTLYDDMINSPEFQEEKRYTLSVEVMSGSYFDGKTVNEIQLPERCEIINIHRDRKDIPPAKQKLVPGDQVQIEMDAQDIEKLYEPLVSMANIY
jgi:Trk K+ transport system NAD-binding subunit